MSLLPDPVRTIRVVHFLFQFLTSSSTIIEALATDLVTQFDALARTAGQVGRRGDSLPRPAVEVRSRKKDMTVASFWEARHDITTAHLGYSYSSGVHSTAVNALPIPSDDEAVVVAAEEEEAEEEERQEQLSPRAWRANVAFYREHRDRTRALRLTRPRSRFGGFRYGSARR